MANPCIPTLPYNCVAQGTKNAGINLADSTLNYVSNQGFGMSLNFGSGTLTGFGLDTTKLPRFMYIITVGHFTVPGSINAKLQQSTDNISFLDVPGSAIVPITTDDKTSTIESSIYTSITQRWVRLMVTVVGTIQSMTIGTLGFTYNGASSYDVSCVRLSI